MNSSLSEHRINSKSKKRSDINAVTFERYLKIELWDEWREFVPETRKNIRMRQRALFELVALGVEDETHPDRSRF